MESFDSESTWARLFAVFESESPDVHKRYKEIDAKLAGDEAKAERKLGSIQAIFIPGLSKGMVAAYNLFDYVAEKVRKAKELGNEIKVYYSSTDGRGAGAQGQPGAAWDGGDWVVAELTARGVDESQLRPTEKVSDPTEYRGLHTRGETDAFVDAAKADNIDSAIIATSPWHRVRHLSCLIGSMAKSGHGLTAYYAGPALADGVNPDTFQMLGSQGSKTQTLSEELGDELKRVEQYWKKGVETSKSWIDQYGAPPAIMDEYIKHRDAGTLKTGWKDYMLKVWGVSV